ncbi:MAG: hypothetical protein MJ237_07790 [bacterium]|nr:hypothetical protein [bacterium]
MSNYNYSHSNNINFKATMSPKLKKDLLKELKECNLPTNYLNYLNGKLTRISSNVVLDDIIRNGDYAYIRLSDGVENVGYKIFTGSKQKFDIIEGLLEENQKNDACLLSQIAYRLLGK